MINQRPMRFRSLKCVSMMPSWIFRNDSSKTFTRAHPIPSPASRGVSISLTLDPGELHAGNPGNCSVHLLTTSLYCAVANPFVTYSLWWCSTTTATIDGESAPPYHCGAVTIPLPCHYLGLMRSNNTTRLKGICIYVTRKCPEADFLLSGQSWNASSNS